MRFHEVVSTSSGVTETSGRLEKIARLARLLKQASPAELPVVIRYLSGKLPQGRIGIGRALISRAAQAPPVAQPPLEILDVHASFDRIAAMSGAGSTAHRAEALRELFAKATAEEQAFLARLLYGELRQGAVEGVMLEAVAKASGTPAGTIRRAAMAAGDLAVVARAALFEGEAALSRFIVQIFQPVRPMLAEPGEDPEAAIEQLGEAALEYKVDGARIQVHKAGDEVKVFSRHLREVTAAVPEVVDAARSLPGQQLILDGEVIALRPDGRPHPFQVTMQRFGRRLDLARLRQDTPLTPLFFDLLDLDGETLIDSPQSRRFDTLVRVVPAPLVIPHLVTSDPARAREFLEAAMSAGHEGVMAKSRRAPYAAGGRGRAWLKVKPARTLDLVVLAVEWGNGRRHGWLSNLHLGARDTERGGFVMLGKTFKGLTDEMLAWQTERLLDLEIGRDDFTVYVRPELVAEIAFNDLQVSPHYPGRLALRFARVKRYRPEKPAAEADTFATIQQVYRQLTGTEPPPRA